MRVEIGLWWLSGWVRWVIDWF